MPRARPRSGCFGAPLRPDNLSSVNDTSKLLGLEERVRDALALGESHFREFKSAYSGALSQKNPRDPKEIAKDIGETLVSFANADGGELLVGVEDDGTVSGIPHKEAIVDSLLDAPRKRVLAQAPIANPLSARIEIDGKLVLFFAVEKGATHIHLTSDGRCLQRRDRENAPTAVERIEFERQEQRSRQYDREYVDAAAVRDLNLDLLNKVSRKVALAMSPEKCLQLLGIADFHSGRVVLRRAALLLFARDINSWHPRCGVRVLRIRGTELLRDAEYNVTRDELEIANVLELIDKAWQLIRPELRQFRRTSGMFEEQTIYPEEACFEALVNAIAHRDYSIEGRLIEVSVFDDRLEFKSPGGLLSTVTITGLRELRGIHESRNVHVARVLRELGYMREVGEGVRRMFRLMRDSELTAPELAADSSSFSVAFRHSSAFSDADQRWLQQFGKVPLTHDERLVILLGRAGRPLSAQQIWDALEIVDTDDYRKVVEALQQKGILKSALDREAATRRAEQLGVARREIPRFLVRSPEDVEGLRNDLLNVVIRRGLRDRFSSADYNAIRDALSAASPYRAGVGRSLHLLGLLADDDTPSPELRSLWEATGSKGQVPLQQPLMGDATEVVEPTDTGAEDLIDADRPGTIVVRELPLGTTQHEVYEVVREFGPVRFVTIPSDVVSGVRQGIALAQMREVTSQGAAVRALRNHLFHGRRLQVDWEPLAAIPRVEGST